MCANRKKRKKTGRPSRWLLAAAIIAAPIAGAVAFNLDRLDQYHRLKQFLPESWRLRLAENSVALTMLPPGAELKARVVEITDGDTLTVLSLDGKNRYPLRLAGADAPELSQRFGPEARDLLGKYYEHVLDVKVIDSTPDGFNLAHIYFNNTDINLELVGAGLAWYDAATLPGSIGLPAAESKARRSGTGLWADSEPVPPRDFRATQ